MTEVLIGKLMQYLRNNKEALDGKLINVLGGIGITNIEFWLFIEDIYKSDLMTNEECFKTVEGLVGLAYVKRGTSDLITKMQDKIMANIDKLAFLDWCRTYYALSMIPSEKHL